ncbi:MAG: hypothetical protein HDT32_05185 [Clostridiales bacterium]|nr:hypothetical protein [Clostridiales bacterium]
MEKNKTSWLTKTVVAHRGLHDNKTLPENSLGAFENAIKHGYGIEFDVWRTNDGELIVHHDSKLNRTCLRDGKVKEIDTSRLDEYKLMNTDYSIPTFAQVLDTVAGRVNLVIEIKPQRAVEATCSQVWEELRNYKGNYCIESFDPRIVRWWAKNHPEVMLGQLCDYYALHKLMVRVCKQHKYVDFLAVSIKNLPSKYYQKLKKLNPELIVVTWTVRTPEQLKLALANTDNMIFETNIKSDDYINAPDTEYNRVKYKK